MKQKATIALFVVTVIWGWTFVWLKQALDTAEIYSSGNQTNIVATLFVALRFGFAIGLFFIFVPSIREEIKGYQVWNDGAILALFHDVIVTLGLFSLLGLEINLSIIAAVLTIVGYSMNDTVVIFDRIRENLKKFSSLKIGEISNKSINETLSRTIITSGTTLLALVSIFVLGGEILRGFSFAMIIGVLIGTYSSIFVASPILKYLNVSFKTIEKEKDEP